MHFEPSIRSTGHMHIPLIHPPDLKVGVIIGDKVEGVASKPYDGNLLPLGNTGYLPGLVVDNSGVSAYFSYVKQGRTTFLPVNRVMRYW